MSIFSKLIFFKIIFILFFAFVSNAEIIKNIVVTGNDRISTETVIMFTETEINDEIGNKELNNILKNLYNTNFFKDVGVELIENKLVISVVENPIIQNLLIEGVKSKALNELLNDRIALKKSSSYDEYFVKKDLEVIESILQEIGYYFFEIETLVSSNVNNTINLTYKINLGEKSYIDEILFLGDKKFKTGKLLNIIASEENKFWKFLSNKKFVNKQRIELDKRLLLNFYKNKGYYNVKIANNTINRKLDENFQLIFNIDSGNRFTFNNFFIDLPDDYDPVFFKKIKNELDKLKSTIYSYKAIEKILKEIETVALNEDYEFVDATIDEKITNDKIDVTINFIQSSKLYVKKINVFGNNITIEDVVRNQLFVDEGDPLNNILLKKSINQIRSLNVFKTVEANIVNTEIDSEKIINIDVEEKATGEISAGAGAGTSGVSTMFAVRENNFLGRGIKLNSSISLGTESVKGLISIVNPNYNNSDKDLIFTLESTDTDRLKNFGYTSRNHGASIGSRFEHLKDFFISPTISANYESLKTSSQATSALKKQEGDYLASNFNYVLDYDKRNQIFQPTDGLRSKFTQKLPIVADKPSIMNAYEISSYHEYLSDLTGVASFYISSVNPVGDTDVKISDRLYLPSRKLRGFEPGKIGPIDNGDFVGGNYISAFNLSSNLPIFESFEKTDFIMYFDMANVWGVDYSSSIHDSNKLRSAAGIGVDWFTPIGPLNFSLSQAITKKKTDKTETFRFNLGTTF
tara:strand:- start:2344 stop:4587 length:2244 start_codon:yes stop_codon:yes gene_type:complete